MITREYLTQRRAELLEQQQQMMARADQARAAAFELGGSIRQVDELLAMLPAEPKKE